MKSKFNPNDWLNKNKGSENSELSNPQPSNHPTIQPSNVSNDIDLVVSRIEATCTDITGSYSDWLHIGFALADEFGEGGRNYFHRISRFYSKYSLSECNNQFDQCLKAQGHGITIKTLFHLAKQAGVEIGREGENEKGGKGENERGGKGENERGRKCENEKDALSPTPQPSSSEPGAPCATPVELPTLPDAIFDTLPDFFQRVVEKAESKEERDILLMGALGATSVCLHKIYGIYDGNQVYPNIYLFITAQASAGKGRLMYCKRLIMPIHWDLRKQSKALQQAYEMEMKEYNLAKGKGSDMEKPVKPPEKLLLIPANSSASGFFQLLSENEGSGLIFETEGDTLAQAIKTDYGNYSDGLRKGTHHEMISYYRKTDREYKEIEEPCISLVLTGTPKQVSALIPNAENGLFSRFIFYHMNIKPVWKNVFAQGNDNTLKEHFNTLGQEFFTLHKALNENPSIQFCLTDQQQIQFNAFFTQIQEKYLTLQGMDYMATIRRLGLIAFRIAMIFTALRIPETGDFSERQFCTDIDFQNTLAMIRVLVKHSSHVFSELPVDVNPTKTDNKKEKFFEKLPLTFTYKDFIELAKTLSITARSAERYMAIFCEKKMIEREQLGIYRNLTMEEDEKE